MLNKLYDSLKNEILKKLDDKKTNTFCLLESKDMLSRNIDNNNLLNVIKLLFNMYDNSVYLTGSLSMFLFDKSLINRNFKDIDLCVTSKSIFNEIKTDFEKHQKKNYFPRRRSPS